MNRLHSNRVGKNSMIERVTGPYIDIFAAASPGSSGLGTGRWRRVLGSCEAVAEEPPSNAEVVVVEEVKRAAMRPVRGLKMRAAPINSLSSLIQSCVFIPCFCDVLVDHGLTPVKLE